MTIEITNPADLHDPVAFGYSHVARASGELVLIAGQYDSDAEGHTTTDDFHEQVERAFANQAEGRFALGAKAVSPSLIPGPPPDD
ncbi:hypothetical protein [Glycomyces tarimensis]